MTFQLNLIIVIFIEPLAKEHRVNGHFLFHIVKTLEAHVVYQVYYYFLVTSSNTVLIIVMMKCDQFNSITVHKTIECISYTGYGQKSKLTTWYMYIVYVYDKSKKNTFII